MKKLRLKKLLILFSFLSLGLKFPCQTFEDQLRENGEADEICMKTVCTDLYRVTKIDHHYCNYEKIPVKGVCNGSDKK